MSMIDAIKPLLESGLIKEDIAQELNEAWESKLKEARESVRAELHEEFAQRYEHDRNVMVVALDKMITEGLTREIKEFHEERKAMNEDRVKGKIKLEENFNKFNKFMVSKLAEEIKELRSDRKVQLENQKKLEKFITHALAREINEFSEDKKAVVEARVKLVAEGRKQLEALKHKFIKESSKKVGALISENLKSELSQLKEDIKQARENNFGRKLFEAFASEFSTTHLSEKAETRKLIQKLEEKETQLAESINALKSKEQLIENKEREVRMIKESHRREKVLDDLLSPLNEEKAAVMKTLLESVRTSKLQSTFDKYLPAVLNNSASKAVSSENSQEMLNEGVKFSEATGNKSAKPVVVEDDDNNNVIEIKRLAGL